MSFIRGLVSLIIAVLVVWLAVSNLQRVDFNLGPVLGSVQVPLYVVGLFSMGFGFIAGAVLVWLNMAPLRRERRAQKRKIKELEKNQTSEISL